MATITNPITAEPAVELCLSPQERLAEFDERFWRCRGPLQFTACLILGARTKPNGLWNTAGFEHLAIRHASSVKGNSAAGY